MKSYFAENIIQTFELELLRSLIGVTLTKFDFDLDNYIQFNPIFSSFEVAWPGTITLVSHNGIPNNIDLEYGGQVSLDLIESEFVNLRINMSKNDYSKGRGIMMNWFKIVKIELYSNNIIEIFDDTTFDRPIINFVKTQNCNELEYKFFRDELIVFHSNDNRRIMVQIFESMNGTVTLHLNEGHIDLILSNKYHIHSPRKNYVKRLTLE